MMRSTRGLGALVALTALWLGSETACAAAPADGIQVLIKDFMFSPMQLTAKVGEQVTWTNQDDEPHTVVNDAGLFRSAALDTGNAYTFRFDTPGTYHVFCSLHPQMTATITVE